MERQFNSLRRRWLCDLKRRGREKKNSGFNYKPEGIGGKSYKKEIRKRKNRLGERTFKYIL